MDENELKTMDGLGPTKITKTWFFMRGGDPDDIFACSEQEAWNQLRNRSNWQRNDIKLVGVSDGKTYANIMAQANNERALLEQKTKQIAVEITKYNKTYDKFKFEDLLEDDDPKVLKLKGILDELNTKYEQASKELNDFNSIIVKKAFDAEFAIAKGHIEMPENFDVFTPNATKRKKILENLGQ